MRKYLLNQEGPATFSLHERGFAPIVLVIVLLFFGSASLLIGKTYISNQISAFIPAPTESGKPIVASPSAETSPTPVESVSTYRSTPKAKITKTPSPTITTSRKPSSTPTTPPVSTNTDNSCSYDLTGPTGAVQVNIKPQSGLVVGDQIVELQAKSGCKVLDGRSTDKQIQIARAGGNGYSSLNTTTYSSVPAGSYSVRIQYKGVWTGYTGVDAVSIQSRSVEFTVEGGTPAPTPTPSPKPKPVCSVSVMPESSGTAPYQASVCVGNETNPYQAIQQEFADYTGDGNWDYQGSSYGCHAYTFQNPGTYSPKAKIVNTSGEESDVCQTSVTIN